MKVVGENCAKPLAGKADLLSGNKFRDILPSHTYNLRRSYLTLGRAWAISVMQNSPKVERIANQTGEAPTP